MNAPVRTRNVPLGDVVEIKGGGTPSKSVPGYYQGDIPWVTPKDMKVWEISDSIDKITEDAIRSSATSFVPPGSVLLVNRSGILKHTLPVGITRRPVAINQDIKALICGKHAHPDYVARIVKAAETIVLGWVRATTADNFPIDNLRRLEIPFPPLAEQKRIAAILDQADALRRLRRRALDRLNTLGQAIFQEMFGDPARNPKGWPVGTIDNLAESTQYGTSAKAGENGELPILRMGNLTSDGQLILQDLKYIDIDPRDIDKFTVARGDILFNRTNSPDLVGKTALYQGEQRMAFAGYLVRLRTNGLAAPEYVSALLNSPYGKATLRGMCKAIIGMANINAKELRKIRLPIPPKLLQDQFASRLHGLTPIAQSMTVQGESYQSLFQALQARAFSGEL